MCGEIDEEARPRADLHQRFVAHARAQLAALPSAAPRSDAALNEYLDGLYADLLRRCVQDGAAAGSDAYARLAMQSLVLARLAGFLAGHVALNEDPLRKLIEAAMHGYAEADAAAAAHHHDHHHHHHHHHDGDDHEHHGHAH